MKVEIYSRAQHCPHCVRAKEMMNDLKMDFKEHMAGRDLSVDELKKEVLERSGVAIDTVPVIFIDDKFIGGRDDFEVWVSQNDMLLSGDDDLDFDMEL
jgi:glutaredoxin 1